MKKALQILAFIPFMGLAQLPILDNFNSVDGTNEWFINHGFLYEDINTGAENGYLTCNLGSSSYLDFRQYEFQSPDYSNRIANAGCDSVKVTVKVDMNIRALDQVKLLYIIGGIGKYKVIPSSGIYSFVFSNQVQYFTLNLVTWGGGSTAGKYVHFDYFQVECKSDPLPVTLVHFCAKKSGKENLIVWETNQEINSDYFILEKSVDGANWGELEQVKSGAYNYRASEFPSTVISYYHLIQVDNNGEKHDLGIRSCLNDNIGADKVIQITNTLGQVVSENFEGMKLYVFESGIVIKKL